MHYYTYALMGSYIWGGDDDNYIEKKKKDDTLAMVTKTIGDYMLIDVIKASTNKILSFMDQNIGETESEDVLNNRYGTYYDALGMYQGLGKHIVNDYGSIFEDMSPQERKARAFVTATESLYMLGVRIPLTPELNKSIRKAIDIWENESYNILPYEKGGRKINRKINR